MATTAQCRIACPWGAYYGLAQFGMPLWLGPPRGARRTMVGYLSLREEGCQLQTTKRLRAQRCPMCDATYSAESAHAQPKCTAVICSSTLAKRRQPLACQLLL
eukprot:5629762-Amphidinium_carterae.1